ncbi:MAG TPA: NADH-quinone oxidoreductase subunit M [Gammaproteobacteria bacterium]|nr:NADH-quinone oxidoreductase subunit M [Gammaproteobacteria bacterium]
MLTAVILVPLLGALGIALWPAWSEKAGGAAAVSIAAVPLVLLIQAWHRFDIGGPEFQLVEQLAWVPSLGMGWRVGVDGIALTIATISALLYVCAVAYPADAKERGRQYYAWFLFIEGASLGVFLSIDLLLFYVFFDLSLVGAYFLINHWGRGDAHRTALKFFIYTFSGSLILLLAILGLYLASKPLSFDMRELIAAQPLAHRGLYGSLVLLGLVVGLGVKVPLFPFHTWMPSAHADAPAPASAILSGVLLKMGVFGFIRIPFAMLRGTFAHYALAIGIFAAISIVYGALVALGQTNMKRRIAYTSMNHMGYAVLGIAAAGAVPATADADSGRLALTGASLELVAHGLIIGALFLITGAFWRRGGELELDSYGGLARQAPRLTVLTVLAALAAFGLPSLAGFVAVLHVFAGSFAVYPWLAGIALLGVVLTAALFLDMVQRLFFGPATPRHEQFSDLNAAEMLPLVLLLSLVVVIGLYPSWMLAVVEASAKLMAP